MDKITVVLAGQPNVGKSSLINAISNAKLKVGNFAGVTVDKLELDVNYCDEKACHDYLLHIVDLPGTYSLVDYTQEERVTKNALLEGDYDVIVNVVDSTHLQRNLLLTSELLELGKKMIVVLNMIDEADNEGIKIDEKQLSIILGVPCIKTSASKNIGIEDFEQAIVEISHNKDVSGKVIYSDFIEEEIERIVKFFEDRGYQSYIPHRQLAVRLLKEDENVYKRMHEEPIWIELQHLLRESLEHIYLHSGSKDLKEIFSDEHFAFAKGAKMEVMEISSMKAKNFTQKIDNLLINKYLGIPIFLLFMWILFQLTFKVGAIPMDLIDASFSWLGDNTKEVLGDGWLGSLVADGMIAGFGAVMMFLPNILILFFGIALLETTGYMSRVSFMLDGFFHKFGLHGKSFIPLVTGFGCSVPAYMAARTLKNERDRLLTLFIIGFMSCGARLPIYVLFIGAFFGEENAGDWLFLIYITGAMLGLISAKILHLYVFKGEDEPFVMEMPKYRMPSGKLIWHTVYGQGKSYINKAGTFILLASMLVWFASNYPKQPELEAQYSVKIEKSLDKNATIKLSNELAEKSLEMSYLGQIGHASSWFFSPLGLDWKMSVALETGLAAKEVVVSTLGVLYSLGEDIDETSGSLRDQLRKNISLPSAISFIVFVMIYLPCLAASMVFAREAGGWKYLIYLFIFTTTTAWVLSFIAYNVTKIVLGA
ncbi:Ferrous iron transport protein B [hydrothermal vent metagenome]|uniref:Ferrous iron transport protein B n=1 Tax=hydrothermal vent metagenome TaxID=652676 RepID=A0A1W1BFI4_9ZZZZ